MKKLIILAMLVGFLFMAIEAKAGFPVVIVPAASTATSGAVVIGLGVAAVAPLIVFSPYFYQFYKHPECSKEPTIGDLSICVQYGPAKK